MYFFHTLASSNMGYVEVTCQVVVHVSVRYYLGVSKFVYTCSSWFTEYVVCIIFHVSVRIYSGV